MARRICIADLIGLEPRGWGTVASNLLTACWESAKLPLLRSLQGRSFFAIYLRDSMELERREHATRDAAQALFGHNG